MKKEETKCMIIKIHDVSFSYAGSDKLVLKDINVDVEGGEFVCILGQSGCGKSTLLRLIAGLEDCTTGEILVDGEKNTWCKFESRSSISGLWLVPLENSRSQYNVGIKKEISGLG